MMNSSVPQSEIQKELERIYAVRFAGLEAYRNEVWRILAQDFFSKWIRPDHTVLDLGCGYCEFINNITTAGKFAMDLNPSARNRLLRGIHFLEQDCSAPWPLRDNSLDVVFTSNFLEHLPTKAALQKTLFEARRCLRAEGYVLALGPNIKFLTGEYWDFFDHHLSLTELSLSEAMIMAGYRVERVIPKFLPYTMSRRFRPPLWTIRAYLKMPLAWRFFGRQFLVIGRK